MATADDLVEDEFYDILKKDVVNVIKLWLIGMFKIRNNIVSRDT